MKKLIECGPMSQSEAAYHHGRIATQVTEYHVPLHVHTACRLPCDSREPSHVQFVLHVPVDRGADGARCRFSDTYTNIYQKNRVDALS